MEAFSADDWRTVERVLIAARAGTIEPDSIPRPSNRAEHSEALDDLERSVWAVPAAAETGDGLCRLRRQWAAFRITRLFALDDIQQILLTLADGVGHRPDTDPTEWRGRVVVSRLTDMASGDYSSTRERWLRDPRTQELVPLIDSDKVMH